MARADLLALTDDGLTQLSNAGLVKRGLRDIAEGNAPQVLENADGIIEARFTDGIVTRLGPGQSPAQAACTCPASGMCRHRVALVLAYRHANQAPTQPADWDPGSLDLAELEATLTVTLRAELARLRLTPLTLKLTRGAVPVASLPMATVRFLTPGNASYARCDCAAGQGCTHIVLAVEGFRASLGANEVTLGTPHVNYAPPGLDEAIGALLTSLLMEGATAGLAAHGRALDRAQGQAESLGATWLVLALEALAAQIAAYENRSALYDENEVLALATEIYARPRAQGIASMGLGEAMETAMSKTRLVSLGARIMARDASLTASIALFDTDTGTPMLIEKTFSPVEPETRLAPDSLPARLMAPGLPLKAAARGQVLTSVAHRRADGTVKFGHGARGKTTLMPRADIITPPAPLLAGNIEALRDAMADQPPLYLRSRNRVAALHVFNVETVTGQYFDTAAQLWSAAVKLADGNGHVLLERRYDAGAPGAIDILAAGMAGEHGPVRQVAGHVRVSHGELICDPWSMTANRLMVPDLDGPVSQAGASAAVPAAGGNGPSSALRFLAGILHAGIKRRQSDLKPEGLRLAADLEAQGFIATAARLRSWSLSPGDPATFGTLSVWLAGLAEH